MVFQKNSDQGKMLVIRVIQAKRKCRFCLKQHHVRQLKILLSCLNNQETVPSDFCEYFITFGVILTSFSENTTRSDDVYRAGLSIWENSLEENSSSCNINTEG